VSPLYSALRGGISGDAGWEGADIVIAIEGRASTGGRDVMADKFVAERGRGSATRAFNRILRLPRYQ